MSVQEPHCPKCRTTTLIEKTLSDDETLIDVCSTCRGAWFDAKELTAVLSVAIEELDVPDDAEKSGRICPRCGVLMWVFLYPETRIEIDTCEDCSGIWLDRGEFRGLNISRAQYQDKSKFEVEDPPPRNFKEATRQFVERTLRRFVKLDF